MGYLPSLRCNEKRKGKPANCCVNQYNDIGQSTLQCGAPGRRSTGKRERQDERTIAFRVQ